MATQSNIFPVVNQISQYVSEINNLKNVKDVQPQLIAVLKKMFLLITQALNDLGANSNQLVMGGPTANKPNAAVAGRLFFDTTTLKLWADDGGTWHFVQLT